MKFALLITLSATMVGMVGCGPPPPPRFAVSGHVTLNRQALGEGVIRFISKSRDGDVTAAIHAGQFHLDQADGPVAGDYDVVVTPLTPELTDAMAAIEAGDRDPLKIRSIPAKYQSPGTLRATVAAERDNQFDFELRGR